LAAVAVGAKQVTVCVHRDAHGLAEVQAAIAERRAAGWGRHGVRITAMSSPRWYVSADATALARFVGGGPAKPRAISAYQQGVKGRPTMVSNAETFAHLTLIARYGASWFRQVGTPQAPGTWLVTLSGAVVRPGVYEVPVGASAADLVARAGGVTEPWQAILLGGYCGTWFPAPEFMDRALDPESLRAGGAFLGAGIVVGLPAQACGLAETARVVGWLAAQSARQCGPCFLGTPAIAKELAGLTWRQDHRAASRVRFAMAMVHRRGACSHPDGIASITASALRVFGDDIRAHLATGGCAWLSRTPTLPVPPPLRRGEPWR
jgi:NADH:ubiquinone oxidoreductase subunit F (NADH-binding)